VAGRSAPWRTTKRTLSSLTHGGLKKHSAGPPGSARCREASAASGAVAGPHPARGGALAGAVAGQLKAGRGN
jgi:hypothetical protein